MHVVYPTCTERGMVKLQLFFNNRDFELYFQHCLVLFVLGQNLNCCWKVILWLKIYSYFVLLWSQVYSWCFFFLHFMFLVKFSYMWSIYLLFPGVRNCSILWRKKDVQYLCLMYWNWDQFSVHITGTVHGLPVFMMQIEFICCPYK